MRNIRNKYLLRMLLFILVTVGGLTIIYNLVAEDYYISESKKVINDIYAQILEMDIGALTKKEKTSLNDCAERGFHVTIVTNEKVIYSTYRQKRERGFLKNQITENQGLYKEDAKALVQDDKSAIKLQGKINRAGTEYYVHIIIRIKNLKSGIELLGKFLILELIIILAISIPFSIYMANKTIKPIEEIGRMTKKMENDEYTEEDTYIFEDDEIGELAENIKNMYGQITSNISKMENYNYILKTQNHNLVEFEERRTEFINTATHELKTPLAIISSQLEMLNFDNSEIMSEYYDSIMEEIQKMSNLIRDMLKTSFDDKVMQYSELEKGNLSELLDKLKGKYEVLLETKNIRSEFEIQDDIFINMNVEQVEQAFNNYLINAIEHTIENALVRICLFTKDNRAIISVYNEGNTIPEDEIDKIWNSFYSEKSKDNNANVGLGLYIVRDIVNYHGGKCYAENMPEGVMFFMEFDLV